MIEKHFIEELITSFNRLARVDGKNIKFMDVADKLEKETLIKILVWVYVVLKRELEKE